KEKNHAIFIQGYRTQRGSSVGRRNSAGRPNQPGVAWLRPQLSANDKFRLSGLPCISHDWKCDSRNDRWARGRRDRGLALRLALQQLRRPRGVTDTARKLTEGRLLLEGRDRRQIS